MRAELLTRDLGAYIRAIWPILEPTTPYVPNWHIDAIAAHLTAVLPDRQIRNLIITVPPRHMKSLSVSVAWPTWLWARLTKDSAGAVTFRGAALRFLFASYAESLSVRDSLKCRRVIQSAWYQSRYASRFTLVDDQNQRTRFENNHRGYRLATSVGGSATGEGGDVLVVDDPINIGEAHSETIRAGTIDWWRQVMSTRLNDPQRGAKVVIMQRVHEADLVGHLLREETGDWEHLSLPTEYEPSRVLLPTSIGFTDPRTEAGALLWPARMDAAAVAASKRQLGAYAYSAQHQQAPTPLAGGILPRNLWRYYRLAAAPTPDQWDDSGISVDAAFKGLEDSSYVAMGAWARVGARRYLLDQVRAQMDFAATIQALKAFSAKHAAIRAKWVEAKANGPALISLLEKEVPGLIGVEPEGSKEARAFFAQPYLEAGNVWLPEDAPWVGDFVEECAAFPRGAYNDQVDQFTQAMVRLHANENTRSAAGVTAMVQHRPIAARRPVAAWRDPRGD